MKKPKNSDFTFTNYTLQYFVNVLSANGWAHTAAEIYKYVQEIKDYPLKSYETKYDLFKALAAQVQERNDRNKTPYYPLQK